MERTILSDSFMMSRSLCQGDYTTVIIIMDAIVTVIATATLLLLPVMYMAIHSYK